MNRFVRDNLLLIIVLSVSVAAVCVLLVFAMMEYVRMADRIASIEKLRGEISKLVKQDPAPVEGNKPRIEQDIKLYRKASGKLRKMFRKPLESAGEAFISTLRPVNPEKDDKGNLVSLTKEKFVTAFNEMWNKSGERNYAQKNFAFRTFRRRFANWNGAMDRFIQVARKHTTEPLGPDDRENSEELMLSSLGIPRRMQDNPEKLERFMRNFQSGLVRMMSKVKFDNSVAWFGFNPDPNAIRSTFPNPAEQYPQVARAWDIIGDVMKRLVAAKVEGFEGIFFRSALDNNKDGMLRGIAGEDVGSFRVFRFRLAVSGSLDSIRELVRLLDTAYKEKRFYIIRSIALYALHDGGNELFLKAEESADEEFGRGDNPPPKKEPRRAPVRGRRGRRGGPAVEEKKAPTQAELLAKAQAEAERRRREKERSSKFKYYERIGYGVVLIGASSPCRALIDFDYIVEK